MMLGNPEAVARSSTDTWITQRLIQNHRLLERIVHEYRNDYNRS